MSYDPKAKEMPMDREQAEKAIKNAWTAGIVSGTITLIVTIVAMAGYSFMGFSAWNLADVAVIGGLTFGIYRKSRTCAIIMLVYFVGSKFLLWSETRSASGLPMALIFGWYFYQGISGTFAWHSLAPATGQAAPQQAGPPAPAPKFNTREEYLAWKEQRGQQTVSMPAVSPGGTGAAPSASSKAALWVVAGLIAAGAAAFFLTNAGQDLGSSSPAPAVWQEFTSAEGSFAIQMPGTPSYEKKNTSTAVGPIDMHLFSLDLAKDAVYIVMYSDYPDVVAQAPADKVLDGGRDGALANVKGKLVGEQNMSLDGFPGREFTIEIPGKGMMKLRTYLVRQRLYQIMAVGTNARIDSEDTVKYLTSFRLLTR